MATPTKLTQLEVINDMLTLLGRSPISSLAPPFTADVATALQVFNKYLRRFQVIGWNFNSEIRVEIYPDASDEFLVPSNVVRIDEVYKYPEYVERAGKLFDKTNKTYTIDKTSLFVDRVIYMDFDDMPEQAKFLVQALAGFEFQVKVLGSTTLTTWTKADVEAAWTEWLQYEAEDADATSHRYGTVWSILNRGIV